MTALPVERGAQPEGPRRVAKPQRVAEVVADDLRDEILNGEITVLPRLEDLVERFDVGPPAVREAMRILETEGLITVRRGKIGGADVHLPAPEGVGYMVSLVLQSQAVPIGDVAAALRQLEPLCAAMCAMRADRAETVVPELEAIVAEQADAVGDRVRTAPLIVRFHRAIVEGCGNTSLVTVVNALETVWSGHEAEEYERRDAEPAADLRLWRASVRDHERIVTAIARGDHRAAASLASRHIEASHAYISNADRARVSAAKTAAITRGRRSPVR